MPRPKGSKNKKNTAPLPTLQEQRDLLLAQKADIDATISAAKEQLRSVNKELKKVDAAIAAAEAAAAAQAAEEAAKAAKAAVSARVEELVAAGASVDDILEKLK